MAISAFVHDTNGAKTEPLPSKHVRPVIGGTDSTLGVSEFSDRYLYRE